MKPKLVVVMPAYNEEAIVASTVRGVRRTLNTPPLADLQSEVIVVDDGSTDGTGELATQTFPFTLRYFWQTNQGDAAARNMGAKQSQADVLVFLDDDILVEADYLTHILKEYTSPQDRIVVGTEYLWPQETSPLAGVSQAPKGPEPNEATVRYDFVDVCSNNMSLRRDAYFSIGMMES